MGPCAGPTRQKLSFFNQLSSNTPKSLRRSDIGQNQNHFVPSRRGAGMQFDRCLREQDEIHGMRVVLRSITLTPTRKPGRATLVGDSCLSPRSQPLARGIFGARAYRGHRVFCPRFSRLRACIRRGACVALEGLCTRSFVLVTSSIGSRGDVVKIESVASDNKTVEFSDVLAFRGEGQHGQAGQRQGDGGSCRPWAWR